MNFKSIMAAIAIGASVTLTSCGGDGGPATPLTKESQFEQLWENKENDGKRFSITGYPSIGSDVTIRNDMEIPVSFSTEPSGEGEYLGSIGLDYKDKKNGIYIPDEFTAEDIKIFDKDGNQLGAKDKITVSFKMNLDVRREPMKASTRTEFKDGTPVEVTTGPKYFGQGPSSIIIEKAQ